MAAGVTFLDIRVRPPQNVPRNGEPVVDWWPTAQVAVRRALLVGEVLGTVRATPKGTLHTAELLYACGGDPEAQAAVLMAASVWDKHRNLPEI
jgi:hypothetical protein